MLKFKNLNKGWFTLIELMVVITIIAILSVAAYKAYDTYIKRANDSVRLQALNQLKWAIETYKSSNIAPPINQYWLVWAWLLTSLPVDPENKFLYQYNADIRWWNKNYSSQWTPWNSYLIATNTPLNDKEWEQYDWERYKQGKATNSYRTNIKNLKYYGWYLILGWWDANYLTDNWIADYTSQNKYSWWVSWWATAPTTPPVVCWSTAWSNGNKQLDVYEWNFDEFSKKASQNMGVNMSEIYWANVPWSICKISIKGDWKWTSVVNPAINIDVITWTEWSSNLYSDNYR